MYLQKSENQSEEVAKYSESLEKELNGLKNAVENFLKMSELEGESYKAAKREFFQNILCSVNSLSDFNKSLKQDIQKLPAKFSQNVASMPVVREEDLLRSIENLNMLIREAQILRKAGVISLKVLEVPLYQYSLRQVEFILERLREFNYDSSFFFDTSQEKAENSAAWINKAAK